MQTECLLLVRALFSEVSPIPCKYAMELLGLWGRAAPAADRRGRETSRRKCARRWYRWAS